MWHIDYHQLFMKQLAKLPAPIRHSIERFFYETLPAADHPWAAHKFENHVGGSLLPDDHAIRQLRRLSPMNAGGDLAA
jgi:mRNA-degrading endonuclease RelE of RelBE toxin-antitoxin system